MKTQHTQGPWQAAHRGSLTILGADGLPVAALTHAAWLKQYPLREDPNGEQLASNARLIAAAPEILAALVDLMDQLEGVGIAIDDQDSGQWHGAEGLSFNQVRAAISKAQGEAA
jgi:hypothetical protein